MTSFAYPPTMSGHSFDPYSTHESYSEYPQTSQPYSTSSSYMVPSYCAALTSIDSYPGMSAFSTEMPRAQDSYDYHDDSSSGMKHAFHTYSPLGTEAEQMMPPRLSASSESGASVQSTSSSAMGSPHLHPKYQQQPEPWNPLLPSQGLGLGQDLTSQEIFTSNPFFTSGMEQEAIMATDKMPGFVDPSILIPFGAPMTTFNYPDPTTTASPRMFEQPPSPAPSHTSSRSHTGKVKPSPHHSPYLQTQQYHPYAYPSGRRPSTSSLRSGNSQSSPRSGSFELSEEDREKGMCPIPDCGRIFKDLKAHMLTHQNERPEKCPIQTCEYHIKGFARKYDKNRHTLTHYKGNMVCGFCPGSGSAAEKSFNRADVFKRHLTSVHGVEQTAPNSRRKSLSLGKTYTNAGQQTLAGTCSTCSVTFANAQEFYEHLDDCVLRVVQQIDPAEDINQKNLLSVADDQQVKDTLDRHYLPSNADFTASDLHEEEDEDEEDFVEKDDANDTTYGSRNGRSGKGTIKGRSRPQPGNASASQNRITKASAGRGRAGLTFSKGGVTMHSGALSGRKKRKNYPTSWGCHAEKMKMKKRVICVYDGPRRLWKDDMMLDSEFEVRMRLPGGDGKAYVTDLDVQTLKRAEALHGATDTERGPWQPDNVYSPED